MCAIERVIGEGDCYFEGKFWMRDLWKQIWGGRFLKEINEGRFVEADLGREVFEGN